MHGSQIPGMDTQVATAHVPLNKPDVAVDGPASSFSAVPVRNPSAVNRLLATHIPDGNGLCRGCPKGSTTVPRQTWPCSLRLYAASAEQMMDPHPGQGTSSKNQNPAQVDMAALHLPYDDRAQRFSSDDHPPERGKPMAEKCKHNTGSYPAEIVEDGKGAVIAQHYRCNGCDIIVKTESK